MDLKWLTPMDEGEFNAFWRGILPVNDLANSLHRFIGVMEAGLTDAAVKHEKMASIRYTEVDEEYRHFFEEMEHESKVEVECLFPALAWSSFFQTIYAFLEHEVIAVVRHMGTVKRIAAHPESNKENKKGIYAAQKFLVNYFGMDPGKHKLWPELETLYQIRNCCAHDRGLLGEPADEGVAPTKAQKRDAIIRKYAAQHPERLFIGSDGHAQPSRELCVHALKTVETFLNRVIDEGRLWLGRWNESQGIKSERTVRVGCLTPRVPFQSDDR